MKIMELVKTFHISLSLPSKGETFPKYFLFCYNRRLSCNEYKRMIKEHFISFFFQQELVGKYVYRKMRIKEDVFVYIDYITNSATSLKCVDSDVRLLEITLKGKDPVHFYFYCLDILPNSIIDLKYMLNAYEKYKRNESGYFRNVKGNIEKKQYKASSGISY